MTGSSIPYQLRPNKYIDRQMFLDLLDRLVIPRGPENYIYISMGGRHLVDHRAVYKRLGLEALFSFDFDANEVKRQMFNRPISTAICEEFSSADLPPRIDEIFTRFKEKTNLIIWLDYTSREYRNQLQETVQTLLKLQHGDVFRITMNANAGLDTDLEQWRKKGYASAAEYRAFLLKGKVDNYLPAEVKSVTKEEFPGVLARCFEMAVAEAERMKHELEFKPVLMTSYKDTSRMLTITCAVVERDMEADFLKPTYTKWKFACKNWDDIQSLSVPNLSSKEQYFLNQHIHESEQGMLAALDFIPETNDLHRPDERASLQAMKSYKDFHRYYPTFRSIED